LVQRNILNFGATYFLLFKVDKITSTVAEGIQAQQLFCVHFGWGESNKGVDPPKPTARAFKEQKKQHMLY